MLKMLQVDVPLLHLFAEGVYARQGVIKAGCLMVGAVHKHSQINIISKGTIQVSKDGEIQTLEGPCSFVSPPGTKRLGLAITDTTWTTILGTNLTDVKEIEQTLTCQTEAEYRKFIECSQSLPLSLP